MGRGLPAIALILLVLLPAATWYFFDSLQAYVAADRKQAALGRQLRQLRASEEAYRRYLAYVDRAENFIARARRAGAVEEAWDRYDVSLQEPVPFDELAALLSQADHGPGYYFRPALLDVRLTASGDEEQGGDGSGADARLTLEGAFLVRRR